LKYNFIQYVFFEKKVYAVYNGVCGEVPEAGEFSRIFVLKVTLLLIVSYGKMGRQDVLVVPSIILLGSNCSPAPPVPVPMIVELIKSTLRLRNFHWATLIAIMV